jgi:hypothetical protein
MESNSPNPSHLLATPFEDDIQSWAIDTLQPTIHFLQNRITLGRYHFPDMTAH